MRGLMKAAPPKEETQTFIDCTGNLQVWRVNGQEKTLLQAADHSKFYSGDCYVFQYSYPGEEKEEVLIGTWFGKQSVEVSSPNRMWLTMFVLHCFCCFKILLVANSFKFVSL